MATAGQMAAASPDNPPPEQEIRRSFQKFFHQNMGTNSTPQQQQLQRTMYGVGTSTTNNACATDNQMQQQQQQMLLANQLQLENLCTPQHFRNLANLDLLNGTTRKVGNNGSIALFQSHGPGSMSQNNGSDMYNRGGMGNNTNNGSNGGAVNQNGMRGVVGGISSSNAGVGGGPNNPQLSVNHDYTDYASIPEEDQALPPEVDANNNLRKRNTGGVVNPFPERLHDMLSKTKVPETVGWAPHGRCFLVRKPKEFESQVMPMYFNHTKLTSFQRQLNLYGFKRITKGVDRGAYYHELFLRGRPRLCTRMRRQKVKGTGQKPLPDPDNEPNFYAMKSVEDVPLQPPGQPQNHQFLPHNNSLDDSAFDTPEERESRAASPVRSGASSNSPFGEINQEKQGFGNSDGLQLDGPILSDLGDLDPRPIPGLQASRRHLAAGSPSAGAAAVGGSDNTVNQSNGGLMDPMASPNGSTVGPLLSSVGMNGHQRHHQHHPQQPQSALMSSQQQQQQQHPTHVSVEPLKATSNDRALEPVKSSALGHYEMSEQKQEEQEQQKKKGFKSTVKNVFANLTSGSKKKKEEKKGGSKPRRSSLIDKSAPRERRESVKFHPEEVWLGTRNERRRSIQAAEQDTRGAVRRLSQHRLSITSIGSLSQSMSKASVSNTSARRMSIMSFESFNYDDDETLQKRMSLVSIGSALCDFKKDMDAAGIQKAHSDSSCAWIDDRLLNRRLSLEKSLDFDALFDDGNSMGSSTRKLVASGSQRSARRVLSTREAAAAVAAEFDFDDDDDEICSVN